MVYQDNMTKFVVLWPLKSKRATDVAMQILDIFLLFGAPHILQSDNGVEFTVSSLRFFSWHSSHSSLKSSNASIETLAYFISASMSGCNVNFLYNIKHIF
jgi:hypothetical protein